MWEITFYKKVEKWNCNRGRIETTMEKVCFTFEGELTDAFEEAVKRGHNPFKNIRWKWVGD